MCKGANKDIKNAAKRAGVFHYEIAEKLGIQDSAFSRKLRRELTAEERSEILSVISDLAVKKAEVS